VQDSKCQGNHLQIFASSRSRNISWFRPNIVDNALLQPGNQEVRSFIDDSFLHSGVSIEDDCSSSALDIVYGGLKYADTDNGRDDGRIESFQCVRHCVECGGGALG